MKTLSDRLRLISARLHKGQIRNTVLHQIKILYRIIDLLKQGKSIKDKEIEEYKYKNPEKVSNLNHQSQILSKGVEKLSRALSILERYITTKP